MANDPNAAHVQGAGPLGTEGHPIGIVGVPGQQPAIVEGTTNAANVLNNTFLAEDSVNAFLTTFRQASIHHRQGVTSADLLAIPASPTGVDVPGGGSLNQTTTYNFTVAAATDYGATTVPAVGSVLTSTDGLNTHAITITIAQVTNALYYDIFLSTAANPLWVARVTETQRAAGDTVTAVGTLNGVSPGAGKVKVNVAGTGVASNSAPFTFNNAYVIPAGVTPIDATGLTTAMVHVQLTLTDLRTAPALGYVVMAAPISQPGVYYQLNPQGPALLTAKRTPLLFTISVGLNSAKEVVVIIYELTGQGASVDVWVDLSR